MIEVRLEPLLLVAEKHNNVTVVVTNSSPAACSRIILKLAFPPELILIGGSPSIEIDQLASGRSLERHLRIRPRCAGRWTVSAPNFSLRDEWDEPSYIKGWTQSLEAVTRRREPEAASARPTHTANQESKPGSGGVFVCYRRIGTSLHADLIDGELVRGLGRSRVFRDVVSIEPGWPFRDVIGSTIASSRVVLVLIGRGWLKAADDAGRRRIDLPHDTVRFEIETALGASHVRTIPVLCDRVGMPPADALPLGIKGLANLHAAQLESAEHARELARKVVEMLA